MTLTTPMVMDLLLAARGAGWKESASAADRTRRAVLALCGKRELGEREMEALLGFVNRIAFDLFHLELYENRDVDFFVEDDGKIHWIALNHIEEIHGR